MIVHPKAKPPLDPITNRPVDRIEDRIEKLLNELEADGEKLIIPAPVLCEILVLAEESGAEYLERFTDNKNFEIKPFDQMAAVELAAMEIESRKRGDKRGGVSSPWAKVKFDRQIVAICKVNGARRIYTDDKDVKIFAEKVGLEAVSTWDLPLPPAKQMNMDYKAESE